MNVCLSVPFAEFESVTVNEQHIYNEERHSVWPARVRIQLCGIPAESSIM